jgi:hypothetical protein
MIREADAQHSTLFLFKIVQKLFIVQGQCHGFIDDTV